MKKKNKWLLVVAAVAVFAASQTVTAKASPNDHELPNEDDLFWRVTSSMDRPDDTAGCEAAIAALSDAEILAYAQQHASDAPQGQGPESWSEDRQQMEMAEIRVQFNQICTMLAQMPTQMQADMAGEADGGVTSNLFSMADWHNVSGLYFQKTGKGRISFTNNLDFLSYKFFRFMSNFDTMVEMNDGYISLNASMIDDIRTYGAQLTMYGLNLGSEQPDIYVDGQLAGSDDVSDITYDANAGTLTFTAKHFSSYRAVAKGSTVKAMSIRKINNKAKVIRYSTHKNTFRVKVKGKNLKPASGQTLSCTLGFEQAIKTGYSKKGKSAYCVFQMSDFDAGSTYPLTLSISGKGEVTKTNAVRVR